ncbi:unnamed protein product [Arabis nemorensis]|uniref:Uncharacterized protein n=1 Tax=Arabis nemorensis TaxID=586526 RepID=A0A565BHA4_9BRAS|nr:unnamed protein product [Arabis nemorensis]
MTNQTTLLDLAYRRRWFSPASLNPSMPSDPPDSLRMWYHRPWFVTVISPLPQSPVLMYAPSTTRLTLWLRSSIAFYGSVDPHFTGHNRFPGTELDPTSQSPVSSVAPPTAKLSPLPSSSLPPSAEIYIAGDGCTDTLAILILS